MCGRFEILSALEIIAKIFQVDTASFDIRPNYNGAQSEDGVVIKSRPLHSLLV